MHILFRLLLLITLLLGQPRAQAEPSLGLQSWTCRNMTFEQVVDFAADHGIRQLQLISSHLDPTAPREESLRKKALLAERGLTAYAFGVAGTTLSKEKDRHLFEFARLMGIKLIVVEPKEPAAWDHLEALVKEYDIKLAIHNHGAGSAFGDPESVHRVLAKRDPRIGVCLDVGWVTAAGFDAEKVFRDYGNRVFDIHFKDKKRETSADGKAVAIDTEIGQGHANYRGLFTAIRETRWQGVMAIETDSKAFASDPHRLVVEAKAFFERNCR